MGLGIYHIEFLLVVAAIVSLLARRLRLPYTVGLVLAGIALAVSRLGPTVELTKELIFLAFLPPLIFEAALSIPWQKLRRDLPLIATMATLGVLLSGGLTALGMHLAVGWEWSTSLVFGSLIAATDPVSVIAMFKETPGAGRLRLLIESESLLNDGTAAVAFTVAVLVATGAGATPLSVLGSTLSMILGGVACGAVVAGVALVLAGRTDDHLVEITFTTVAAYGAFLLAEHLGVSGVLATLTAGIIIGNAEQSGFLTEKGRDAVLAFWEYAAFAINSLVFLLIGMQEARADLVATVPTEVAAIALVVLARAAAVYPCCAIYCRSRMKVPARYQHVLFWGGLRGALALALTLGLPPEFPHRQQVTTAAFAVVAFSVVVQGLTVTPLMRRMGVIDLEQA